MKLLIHSLVIFAAFGFVFLLESFLHTYEIQLLALGVLSYLIFFWFGRKKTNSDLPYANSFETFLLITTIMLLIAATGGVSSFAFFLLYFLPFRIIFLFEPRSLLSFIAGALLFFLPELHQLPNAESYIKLGSIIFITPLAYFFGQASRAIGEQTGEIEAMRDRALETAQVISEDVQNILQENQHIESEEIEKLNEILQEAEDLRQEGKE